MPRFFADNPCCAEPHAHEFYQIIWFRRGHGTHHVDFVDYPVIIFKDDTYDYYAGGLNGSYYLSLFNHPLILSADIFVDGWKKGWGEVQGRLSAVMVLKNTKQTSFSVGLMGMTLYSSTPIVPIITYWHRFGNPNLSLDITLPSQMYLRYQMRHQRISLGASMSSDNFYLNTDLKGSPSVCLFTETVVKHLLCKIRNNSYVKALKFGNNSFK